MPVTEALQKKAEADKWGTEQIALTSPQQTEHAQTDDVTYIPQEREVLVSGLSAMQKFHLNAVPILMMICAVYSPPLLPLLLPILFAIFVYEPPTATEETPSRLGLLIHPDHLTYSNAHL